MAADLHIHIFEGITLKDLELFFENTLGSRWFKSDPSLCLRLEDEKPVYERVINTPNIWVGEVSWLKAMVFEKPADFIPQAIGKIHEIIGEELPDIDDILIHDIKCAMTLPNSTGYSLANAESILEFLEQHRGKKVFTVSW